MICFLCSYVQRDNVTLKSAKDYIEASKKHIQEIIEDFKAQVTLKSVIPRGSTAIIGSKGYKIQQRKKSSRSYGVILCRLSSQTERKTQCPVQSQPSRRMEMTPRVDQRSQTWLSSVL